MLLQTLGVMEMQLGTRELYNRLCDAAEEYRERIDAGKVAPPSRRFDGDDWTPIEQFLKDWRPPSDEH